MEDDEIIIGISDINTKSDSKNNNTKKNKKKSKKKNNKNKPSNSKQKKVRAGSGKQRKGKNIIKDLIIFLIVIICILLFFSSSLFNVQYIEVSGNEKLSKEKIISLSSIEMYTNMFKFNKWNVIERLKENAYIENVKISRTIPHTVNIEIEEREINFMLQFADSYVYINNQGYMLEISNTKKNVPILIGFTTDLSNIKAGNRIDSEDLKKMNSIIRIYENLKTNDLDDLISKIDISNDKNYTLILETEGKTVYLGDASDLNTRILCLKSILEQSAGKRGEIFLNVDLNTQRAYFRESIN